MLDLAVKYEDKLKLLFANIAMDEEYMFFDLNSWRDEIQIDKSTWNIHQFVSLNRKGEVIGYFKYNINRDTRICGGLAIVNFKKDSLSKCFGNDLRQVIDDILNRYQFEKVGFGVVVGNPAEKFYDKYISKIGGRIIGVYEKDCRLLDGNYYDYKTYEVLKEGYLTSYMNEQMKGVN